jgi:integrase
MGRQTVYKNVRAVTKSSIEIRFAYPDPKTEQRERLKLEPTPANLKRAFAHLVLINDAIADGSFDYAKTFPNSKRAPLYTNTGLVYPYLKSWLARQVHIKSGTYVFYKRIIEGLVKGSVLEETRLVDLTWAKVRDWAIDMDVKPKTRSGRLTPLRSALDDAVDDGIIPSNPLTGRKLKQQTVIIPSEASRIDPFSWQEREAINKAATRQFGLMLIVSFFTGMRPEEMRGLTWDRVDFVGRTVLIDRVITDASLGKFEPPKTQHSYRTVDLVGPAFDALMAYKQYSFLQGHLIFMNPQTGRPYSTTNKIRAQWISVLKKAGVRYRVPYQTRHTYASTSLAVGEDLAYIAKQMGHSDISVTLKYYARFIQNTGVKHGSKVEEAYQKTLSK